MSHRSWDELLLDFHKELLRPFYVQPRNVFYIQFRVISQHELMKNSIRQALRGLLANTLEIERRREREFAGVYPIREFQAFYPTSVSVDSEYLRCEPTFKRRDHYFGARNEGRLISLIITASESARRMPLRRRLGHPKRKSILPLVLAICRQLRIGQEPIGYRYQQLRRHISQAGIISLTV